MTPRTPARYGYADPPYLGCCKLYDHYHGDDGRCWDDPRSTVLMSKRDEYLDCGCVPPGSLNEPGRHICGKYNPPTLVLERILAKHQLADILPCGVLCTCGAELAALNPPFDDAEVKGEPLALAVHQLQEMEGLIR